MRVAVVDSGIDLEHPDLRVAGGLSCVPGSVPDQFGAVDSHGTHVAGIIAARGRAPKGIRGIAPDVELLSFRVFDRSADSGSSFGIIRALNEAVRQECDLVNMSLSFEPDSRTGLPVVDEAVQQALREADEHGILVFAAAGNDWRQPVMYPACDELAIAVGAAGRRDTFPRKSSESGDVSAPYGKSRSNFVAAFSNKGNDMDAIAAGVGVVSTVPGGHAPMSGTSMACPAVTGVMARLLSENRRVRRMPRNAARSAAMRQLLLSHCRKLGFGLEFEGRGCPR